MNKSQRSRLEVIEYFTLLEAAEEMLALLEESQINIGGTWRERRDALLKRLKVDEL